MAPADEMIADVEQARLLKAVLNCVQNAVVHNRAGTTVDVTMAIDGPDLVITVEDGGAGVDPAVLDRAFEPFVQGSASSGGSGLGLAVVAAVAAPLVGLDVARSPRSLATA